MRRSKHIERYTINKANSPTVDSSCKKDSKSEANKEENNECGVAKARSQSASSLVSDSLVQDRSLVSNARHETLKRM